MSAFTSYAAMGAPFTEADMPAPPTHCRCGRQLVLDREDDGYTPTGELDEYPVWRCPLTMGRWNRLMMRHVWPHQEYEPGHFVKPYWHERTYR